MLGQADWDIVKRGWQAHVLGKAPHYFKDPVEVVKTLRVSDSHCTEHLRQGKDSFRFPMLMIAVEA